MSGRSDGAMVSSKENEGTIFEALWAPRWFGQDQALAHGQEAVFAFRGPVPPPPSSFTVLAAGLEKPRYETRCRLIGIHHDQLGKLQAIETDRSGYRFIRSDGGIVHVGADGSLEDERALPPPDWTVRCTFEMLP